MPEPLGNEIQVVAMVDASHAGDKLIFRSHTGVIIYMNNTPIEFFSKMKTQWKLARLFWNLWQPESKWRK